MLFNYELKKIWRRVSPILVAVVLGLTTVATMVLTLIFFHQAPTKTNDANTIHAAYAKLQAKIENWNPTHHDSFADAFNSFYNDYKIMNASVTADPDKLVANYQTAKASFNEFNLQYYNNPIYGVSGNADNYLLVRTEYFDAFDSIIQQLDEFFLQDYSSNAQIVDGLKKPNAACENASLQTILQNLFYAQKLNETDLVELKQTFANHPAGKSDYDYTHAYDYVLNRYWLAVANASTYDGNLSQYKGFEAYSDVMTSTRACELANYRLTHPNEDFAAPFAFGKIYNNSSQVSLFDFIFTNMEMAMLPLTLLVMIWAACSFFTDHYQNTLVTPLAAGKKRSTVILTKTSVIITLTATALLALIGVYAVCGLLFFHAYISPDILFLFNGSKAMTMSAMNYFALYFLNLIFKLLPLIAVCGLFSFVKNKPFVIVGLTTFVCIIVVILNACLGHFAFYQFVPLMGLDPLRYFGAKLLFAPMPETYNIWYTFPVVAGMNIILYWALIHTFRRHDF